MAGKSGGFGNTVSSGKRAVTVSVSEIKKNKAGKVTAGDQLALTGLAAWCPVPSRGGAMGCGCGWGPPRQPRGWLPFCKSWSYASPVNIVHIVFESLHVNPNNHKVMAIHMGVLTHLQTERRDRLQPNQEGSSKHQTYYHITL